MAMVVMDKQDYIDKALYLLSDTSTYKTMHKDPTIRLRNSLITKLKDVKQQGGINDITYRKYTKLVWSPRFYGLPKIHKTGTPLRPFMSSRGSITYVMAKELAGSIHSLVGQSLHHLRNTQHFVQHIQQAKLETGDVMASYDVKDLFTSVPVNPCKYK